MEKINDERKDCNSLDMTLGFGFLQVQNLEPFQNFLKKIEVDEKEEKLTMTFKKFETTPMIFDFKHQTMFISSKMGKSFDKFLTVTFEYCKDKKAILIRTFRFSKGHLEKGIKYISIKNQKNYKLTNFLNIYSDNYLKTSKKLIENDNDYIFPVPDFYRPCLVEN